MSHRIIARFALACAAISLFVIPAQAAWTGVHKDASNNALQSTESDLDNFETDLDWVTTGALLAADAGVAIHGGVIYAPAHDNADTWSNYTDDVSTIKAFSGADGSETWESPELEAGISVGYGSASTPTVDPDSGAIYAASGQTIYKLNASTGAIDGSFRMDSTTLPGCESYCYVCNGSPAVGDNYVYLETYFNYDYATTSSAVIAFSEDLTTAVWWDYTKGTGTGTPTFVDSTESGAAADYLYTASLTGVTCRNADTGAVVWDSSSVTSPWYTTYSLFASLTYEDGYIYGVTYQFFGSATEVFRANALTGELDWNVTGLNTDMPPVVSNGQVFVHGGYYYDYSGGGLIAEASLGVFNATDGSTVNTYATNGNDYKAGIVLTPGKVFMHNGSTLMILDQNNSMAEISTASAYYTGPCAMDDDGNLYVRAGNELYCYNAALTPVEMSGWTIE